MERLLCKTIPALLSIHEIYVVKEEDGQQIIGHSNCNWSTNETPIKVPDKQPVH